MKIPELFCQPQTLLLDGGFGDAFGCWPAPGAKAGGTEPDRAGPGAQHPWAYAAAGSRVLNTNILALPPQAGGQRLCTVEQVVQAAVALCRQAAEPFGALTALDIGPLGDAGAGRPAEL